MIWVLFFTLMRGESVDTKLIRMPSKEECVRVGNILNDKYQERDRFLSSRTFCIEMKRDTKTI